MKTQKCEWELELEGNDENLNLTFKKLLGERI